MALPEKFVSEIDGPYADPIKIEDKMGKTDSRNSLFKTHSDAKTMMPKNSRNSTEICSERETPKINVNISPVVKKNNNKVEVFSDVPDGK